MPAHSRHHPPGTPWPLVVCLLGLAVSSAVLLLLLPALVGDGEGRPSLALAAAAASLAFGAGLRHLQGARRRPSSGR